MCEVLYRSGAMSINALAKLLRRSDKNVYDDVKLLKTIGLVEVDERGLYFVAWDEIITTIRLAT
jgi:predicted transcriptional regulator